MNKQKILVGSPVYQKPAILAEFLTSMKNLSSNSIQIDYFFVDDNVDEKSSRMLHAFVRDGATVTVIDGKRQEGYLCNEDTHFWDDLLMLKVAMYKNNIIKYAVKEKYDYLFFADSDLVLHPGLVEHLIEADKDIISEIFWTEWHKGQPLEPNVWLFDEYDMAPKHPDKSAGPLELEMCSQQFLYKLKTKGVHEVGGLGACTLISYKALAAGVTFQPIKNLTIRGEDRFFCIRAIVLGFDLFVDTHYPAYHIYREKDIAGVKEYSNNCTRVQCMGNVSVAKSNKLVLSMTVKNESSRYIRLVLESLRGHVDAAIIIDDGSTDDTILICREILQDIPLHIIRNDQSMFSNEVELRKKQWDEAIKTDPDWILNMDADEILEDGFWNEAETLMANNEADSYSFRLFDMWSNTHYREDQYWNAHTRYSPFLMRCRPFMDYSWKETSQHCGRFPLLPFWLNNLSSEYRVKHLGWSSQADRIEKHQRYKTLDPQGRCGVQEQYDSIMDADPTLIPWQDN